MAGVGNRLRDTTHVLGEHVEDCLGGPCGPRVQPTGKPFGTTEEALAQWSGTHISDAERLAGFGTSASPDEYALDGALNLLEHPLGKPQKSPKVTLAMANLVPVIRTLKDPNKTVPALRRRQAAAAERAGTNLWDITDAPGGAHVTAQTVVKHLPGDPALWEQALADGLDTDTADQLVASVGYPDGPAYLGQAIAYGVRDQVVRQGGSMSADELATKLPHFYDASLCKPRGDGTTCDFVTLHGEPLSVEKFHEHVAAGDVSRDHPFRVTDTLGSSREIVSAHSSIPDVVLSVDDRGTPEGPADEGVVSRVAKGVITWTWDGSLYRATDAVKELIQPAADMALTTALMLNPLRPTSYPEDTWMGQVERAVNRATWQGATRTYENLKAVPESTARLAGTLVELLLHPRYYYQVFKDMPAGDATQQVVTAAAAAALLRGNPTTSTAVPPSTPRMALAGGVSSELEVEAAAATPHAPSGGTAVGFVMPGDGETPDFRWTPPGDEDEVTRGAEDETRSGSDPSETAEPETFTQTMAPKPPGSPPGRRIGLVGNSENGWLIALTKDSKHEAELQRVEPNQQPRLGGTASVGALGTRANIQETTAAFPSSGDETGTFGVGNTGSPATRGQHKPSTLQQIENAGLQIGSLEEILEDRRRQGLPIDVVVAPSLSNESVTALFDVLSPSDSQPGLESGSTLHFSTFDALSNLKPQEGSIPTWPDAQFRYAVEMMKQFARSKLSRVDRITVRIGANLENRYPQRLHVHPEGIVYTFSRPGSDAAGVNFGTLVIPGSSELFDSANAAISPTHSPTDFTFMQLYEAEAPWASVAPTLIDNDWQLVQPDGGQGVYLGYYVMHSAYPHDQAKHPLNPRDVITIVIIGASK